MCCRLCKDCLKGWILLSVCVLILAFVFNPFNPLPPHPPPPDFSYDHRIEFNLDNLHTPKSHEEIVDIIKNAHEGNKKIRVLAAGHSWSHIAQTQDIMISLHEYTGISVDKDNLKVTVKAGTSLRDLSELLDKEGLGMLNLGSVAAQSLGGAISTATHGTGLGVGNLASLVIMVKFISGSGETIVLSEDDEDPSRFRAAVVSIGMFGVLSEITIQVATAFNLKEIRTPYTLQECLDRLDELVKGHTYVKMWVEFYNDFCALYQTERTTEPRTGNPGRIESYLMYYSFAITTRVTFLIPSLTKFAMLLVDYVGLGMTTTRVDNSYLIFNDFFELPIHQESEIIVPYSDSVKLVETIRDVVLDNNFPVNYITEVRFISGDNNHLSPQFGMTEGSCAVTLTIYGREDIVAEYFDAVYNATRVFQGRIHWGKHFSTATHTDFQRWYQNFDHFANLQEQYDPKGIFVNDFIRETFNFGGEN